MTQLLVTMMAIITIVTIASAATFSSFQLHPFHLHHEEKSAELWLGGDINLGDGGRGQLQGISGIVQGAAGIVNLEGPVAPRLVAKEKPAKGKLRLWNAPQALDELSTLNVRVAGIANNHAGDAGNNGPQQSAKRLREKGFVTAGGPAGVALLQVNGVYIAVTAHDLTQGLPANLAVELAAARGQADVLIATFHVSGPPSYLPRPELRRAVEIAYQAGASVIAAHAVIAWGLGNVAFACDCTREQDAILLRVRVGTSGAVQADVFPIQAGLNNRPALPSQDAKGVFDLLEAIGSNKLQRNASSASF
jgi:hypothetical protein